MTASRSPSGFLDALIREYLFKPRPLGVFKVITEYSTETDDALGLLQAQEQIIFNQCQEIRVLAGISFLLFTFLLLK